MKKYETGRVPLFMFLSLSVLCLFLFVGCSESKIISASKIVRGKLTLSWNDVPGAISYNIYFDRKPGLTQWTSHRIPNASSPITVTDLVIGNNYYFGIAVLSHSGESSILSEKAYAVTDEDGSIHFGDLAPVSLNVKGQVEKEQPPEGQATLAWDKVPNAVSYNIYWGESPGVTKRNGKKITNATNPYTLKGLARGKTYYFVVTSVDNSGESRESGELSFSIKE